MSYEPPLTDPSSVPTAAASPSAAASLDLDRIREQFPALARVHRGRPVAYFDGPGGTQVPRVVVESMSDYLFHHNANTHWRYPTSAETDVAIDAARAALADLLNASPEEIAFGQNMTSLTFHLSRALARQWSPGDEVIVTELDHHGNVDPWRHAAADRGLTVQTVRVRPETGQLDWDELVAHLSSPRVKLLAIGAASNAIGTVSDVKRAGRLAREAGALVFVDAVHYAPHALVDVRDLDCDFLACSVYKFYGPHLGALYCRRALIDTIDVPKVRPAPDEGPERLENGTQGHEAIAGARAAVDFLASLGSLIETRRREPWERSSEDFKDDDTLVDATVEASAGVDRRAALARSFAAMHAHGERLMVRLWGGLQQIPGVRLYGPEPGKPRTPTVGFTVARKTSDAVAEALADQGVFVSHGDFYAMTLVERLGAAADGLVRAGCACYTTPEEVERLLVGVRQVAR